MSMQAEAPDSLDQATRKIAFSCHEAELATVFVSGTFNDWRADGYPFQRDEPGGWSAVLDLPIGRYEFVFTVDGRWAASQAVNTSVATAPNVPNTLGTMNGVMEVN